jgi:hypothetical protein
MLVPILLFAQLAVPSMKSLQCSHDANLRTDFLAAVRFDLFVPMRIRASPREYGERLPGCAMYEIGGGRVNS